NLPLAAFYPRLDPHSCLAGRAVAPDTIVAKHPYRHFFQVTQINTYVRLEFFQVQDGIADQLPGSMKSNVSSPVSPEELHTLFPHPLTSDQHILHGAAFTKRIYR